MLQVTQIGETVRAVAELVGPSVAALGRGWGRGSGVVIAPNRLLTNAHVLRGEDVAVTFGGGEPVLGHVSGADADVDLAVVTADTAHTEPISWDPEIAAAAGIGTSVFALADPGGRGLYVTFGIVAAAGRPVRGPRGRRIPGSLEHTAPLPRGSSGGPIVDGEGRLLGINTVRLDGGFILALPADAAMAQRVDALARGEIMARPRLGLALARTRAHGLLVRAVQDASPAAVAGLVPGDLLVGVEGRALRSVDDLFDALENVAHPPALTLTVVRAGDERDVPVRLLQ